MRTPLKRALVIGTTLAVTGGAGVAYAAWLANGEGTSTAAATSAQALSTLDASADTSAALFPGGSSDVKLTISNPNGYPVKITKVTDSAPITARAGSGKGACSITGVSFVDQLNVDLAVPANGSATFTFAGAALMSNASEDGCQGATFDIPVSFTGASNAS